MSSVQTPSLISEFAIIVDPKDNVAVVKKATSPGLALVLPDESPIEMRAAVPPGHRFATKDIAAGEFVLQFGQPIGTSLGIKQGEQITHDNMTTFRSCAIFRKTCTRPLRIISRSTSARRLWVIDALTAASERATTF